jgi:hypothetical protein
MLRQAIFCISFVSILSGLPLFSDQNIESPPSSNITATPDLECPTEFYLQQDPCMRVFRVVANDKILGTILNSAYGRFDFYDAKKQKQWTNLLDTLSDNSGKWLGQLKWREDPELAKWFWQRKKFSYVRMSYIDICAADGKEVLATFHPDAQGDEECFVFLDPKTNQTLAVASWFWTPAGTGWFSFTDPKVQNWHILIVDRARLQERKISNVFLIWTLLKHSQDHFPFNRSGYDYVTELK